MNITQSFYDNLASQYDKLFLDWQATTREQAAILDRIFRENGFDRSAAVLDCACGIGTQAIGLACAGYRVNGSKDTNQKHGLHHVLRQSSFICCGVFCAGIDRSNTS